VALAGNPPLRQTVVKIIGEGTAKYAKYANQIFLSRGSRGSRLKMGWTTGGGGRNVGRESGISGGERREMDGAKNWLGHLQIFRLSELVRF
jgi:hypothetical protein